MIVLNTVDCVWNVGKRMGVDQEATKREIIFINKQVLATNEWLQNSHNDDKIIETHSPTSN